MADKQNGVRRLVHPVCLKVIVIKRSVNSNLGGIAALRIG